MERFGWIRLCWVAHTQPYDGFGCLKRDRAKTLLHSTEGSSTNRNIAHVLKTGGRWPGIASTKTMDSGFNLTALLCSTDSCRDRTDEQKEGPKISILVLMSQYDYILITAAQQKLNFSLLILSNKLSVE